MLLFIQCLFIVVINGGGESELSWLCKWRRKGNCKLCNGHSVLFNWSVDVVNKKIPV